MVRTIELPLLRKDDGDNTDVCHIPCAAGKELLEVNVWTNGVGQYMDWVMTQASNTGSGARLPLLQCPTAAAAAIASDQRTCAYNLATVYKTRHCMYNNYPAESYRMAFWSRFGTFSESKTPKQLPVIQVKYGGNEVETFQQFHAKSFSIPTPSSSSSSTSKPCEGSLLEMYGYVDRTQLQLPLAYRFANPFYGRDTWGPAPQQYLTGALTATRKLHYAWTCIPVDVCMVFDFNRDLSLTSSTAEVLLSVDGVIQRHVEEKWRDHSSSSSGQRQEELPLSSVRYTQIGNCQQSDCDEGESLLAVNYDVGDDTNLELHWTLLQGPEDSSSWFQTEAAVFSEQPLLSHRSYQYQTCVKDGYPVEFNVQKLKKATNSTVTVTLNGKAYALSELFSNDSNEFVGLSLRIDDDNDSSSPSTGLLVGTIVGAIVVVAALLFVVRHYYCMSRTMAQENEPLDDDCPSATTDKRTTNVNSNPPSDNDTAIPERAAAAEP